MATTSAAPKQLSFEYLPDNVKAAVPELVTHYIKALETLDCQLFSGNAVFWPGTTVRVSTNDGDQHILQRIVYCRLASESPRLCFSFHQKMNKRMTDDPHGLGWPASINAWLVFTGHFFPTSNFLRCFPDSEAVMMLTSTLRQCLYLLTCIADEKLSYGGEDPSPIMDVAMSMSTQIMVILDKRRELCALVAADRVKMGLAIGLASS